jgi:hypothetical protein
VTLETRFVSVYSNDDKEHYGIYIIQAMYVLKSEVKRGRSV